MRSTFLVLALSVPTLALIGCDGGLNCDLMAVTSLSVTLEDASGAVIPADLVDMSFTADGGAPEDCQEFDGSWVCGWEVTGELVVTAAAQGYEDATHTVTIEAGECHPITQSAAIVMTEAPQQAFDEPKAFTYVLFEGTDCDDALANGMNCAMWMAFCPDGTGEIVLTDILSDGTYLLDDDGLDAAWQGGDAPAQMRFDWQGADLVDAATGDVWVETDAPTCD